jgi:hypothetical protein
MPPSSLPRRSRCVVDKVIGTAVALLVLALVFAAMYRAWRRREQRDAVIEIPAVTSTHTTEVLSVATLYVATTPQDSVLERLALPHLSFRSAAQLSASPAGITIAPQGERASTIPAESIRGIRRAQVAIDKVVERDGLTAIDWTAVNRETSSPLFVTSFFRISDLALRAEVEAHLRTLFVPSTLESKEVSS